MKRYHNYLINIGAIGLCLISHAFYAADQDNSIVNYIENRSNLTRSDVEKWKFLWLRSFAEPVVGGATLYAAYQVGSLGRQAATHNTLIKSVFEGQYIPQLLKNAEPLATNEWIWAGVGVLSVGLAAYKLFYPRLQTGIIHKIKKYDVLCKDLAVANGPYGSLLEFEQALSQPGNAIWQYGNAIAKQKGFNNLIEQAGFAIILIDQLLASGSKFNSENINLLALRDRIEKYKENLNYNKNFILAEALTEQDQRIAKKIWRGLEYAGGLLVAGAAATVAIKQIKNMAMQWALVKDIFQEGERIWTTYFSSSSQTIQSSEEQS
jgi:hypothetical protein